MFLLAHAGHFTGDPWHDSWTVAVLAAAIVPVARMAFNVARLWVKLRGWRRKR